MAQRERIEEPTDAEAVASASGSLAGLTEQGRRLAMARYEVIRPFLEEGVPLEQIAGTQPTNARTLRRWVTRYRRDGLAGLVPKDRTDRGKRRILSDAAQRLVEGLALRKPPLTVASIHRQVASWLAERGERPPSYGTVRNVIRDLPPSLVTLAHQGDKAYSEAFDLVHRREASAPNAIWQADHTLLDILLLREGKEPAKPWLTTVIDDHSRAVAGYYLAFEAPCALHTSLALRQAIWRKEDPRWHVCGIPQVLYSDNGSDFTSEHLAQVSADLKIRLTKSLPGRPRGRGRIERFFETVNQMLLCELPGYSPSAGAVRGEPSLTLRDFDRRFRDFVLGVYHQREHGETKMPPQARWEADGFLPQMPQSVEQLDLLLLTVAKTRRVRRDGIWFLGMRYISPTLAAYVGEDVILRYDPRDVAEVRVFYEGCFLCRAICQELAGVTVSLREIVQARNRRRRELRRQLKDRRRTVDALLDLRRWELPGEEEPPEPEPEPSSSRLKRYWNE